MLTIGKDDDDEVYFQQNFNDAKNDSHNSLSNLDSISVSLANEAKLAFFNRYHVVYRQCHILLTDKNFSEDNSNLVSSTT